MFEGMSASRAQRRREKKQAAKKQVRYNLSPEQIREISMKEAQKEMDRVRDLIILETANNSVCAALLALRDQFEFGKKRGQRFLAKYEEIFSDIVEGHLSFDDLRETIEHELGIRMVSYEEEIDE